MILLVADEAYGEQTGVYLHMMRVKAPSQLASDPENGRRIWETGEKLLAPHAG